MTTVFPGAIDSLPRPLPGTKTNAGGGLNLSTVIDNISDAVEAIETVLGAGISTPNGVMRKLGTVSGTGASGVLEITGIPGTYRDLEVSWCGRSDAAGAGGSVARLTFESSPTAGAYNDQRFAATGTGLAGVEDIGTPDFINVGNVPSAGATANVIGTGRFWVNEYAGSSFKGVIALGNAVLDLAAGNHPIKNATGTFESTLAITRVRLTLASGNWTAASRLTVYGIPS